MEVKTLDLRGREEALGISTEQKDGGMRGLTLVQKVKVGQCFLPAGLCGQSIASFAFRRLQKPGDLFLRDVIHGCPGAGGSIKRQCSQFADSFKVFDQAGVQSSSQVRADWCQILRADWC